MTLKENKGQEEILGFVVVVVFVAVIALVVLGFALQSDSQQTGGESSDIAHFLESTFAMTSECTLRVPHHASVGEVASVCVADSKRICEEGEQACAVLNRTLSKTIAAAWDMSNASAIQGYTLTLTHRLSLSSERPLLTQQQGTCGGRWHIGEHLQPAQGRRGTLITSLKLCFA